MHKGSHKPLLSCLLKFVCCGCVSLQNVFFFFFFFKKLPLKMTYVNMCVRLSVRGTPDPPVTRAPDGTGKSLALISLPL